MTDASAKGNKFRKVELDEYVREFSMRFPAGTIIPDADTAQFIEEISASLGWPEVTFVRSVKDPEPPRYSSPEAEQQAILAARDNAIPLLADIRTFAADGDKNALSELVQLLAENMAWLEGYSYRDKGNLKSLGAYLGVWPVTLSLRPLKQRQADDYLARIGLDSKSDPAPEWHQLAARAEAKDPELPRFDNPADKGRAILDMSYSAGRLLEELRLYVADGNQLATVSFVLLLAENVTWLESYSVRDKGNLKATANRAPVWPVIMARCSRRTKAAAEYLKRIELGTKAQISLSPKWGTSWRKGGRDDGAIATHFARAIRIAVHNARNFFLCYDKRLETNGPLSRAAWAKVPQWVKDAGKLPPLTKESAPQWFEIGWNILVEKHGGQPENDELLRKLCDDYRANKYARRYAKIAGPFSSKEILNRKESPPATAAADRCSRIKERIRNALISLAPS
jgi:hypothetical protein